MKDEEKTKEQLINELAEMSQRIAELEVSETEHSRSEQKLLESEKRFRDITENALEWIWECDTDGKYIYAGSVVEKILGYKPEEVLEKHFYDLFHPEDRQELKKAAFEVFAKKQPFREFINRNVHKDGKTVWLSTSGVPILDEKGNLLGYRGADIDISERKQTDAALKQSEERYRTLVEESFDGIFVQKGSKIIFTNQRLNEMLGYEEGELLGLDHWLVYHPDYQKLTRERAQARMQGEMVPSQYEVKLQRKDGSWFYGEINARVISFEGEPGVQVWVKDITERKHAEEALKESEERYRTLFEGSRDAVYITTREGKFIDANQSTLDLFGYTREEMRRLKAHKLYADPLNSRTFQKEVEQKGFVRDYEVKLHKKDGTEMDCLFTVSVRRANDGSILGYYGIIRDITESKRAEKSLRESEQKYKTILKSIEEGYFEVDIAGNFTFVNDSMCKILGYSQDELIGMNNRKYMDEDNARKVYQGFNKVYKTGIPSKVLDWELIRKDETKRFVEISVSLIRDSEGHRIGFRGILRDVTEKKKIEAELIQTRNFLQNIFDSSIDGITTTDLHGNVMFTSPRVKNILGYEQNEIIGKKIHFLYSNGIEDAKTIMKELTEKGELRNHEMKLIRKDGELIDINLSASLLMDERGEVIGTIGIYRDITEKKKLEAQLLQAQKMEAIGILAGGVAHDFNNILQTIRGHTDLAMMKLDETDPLYRDLKQIDLSAGRAASLTRQLLLFSRRQQMEFTPINLNTMVENLLKMLHRLIGEDISIKTELDPELWTVQADAGTIEQVIMNLTVNARDAMPEGGEITVKTENVHVDKKYCKTYTYARPGKFVCLMIEDTGVGMDKETIQHIFDPFFSTKGPGKGTGLGLSVVYGIVKQHEGWINVYSDSEPGQGSTLKVYLPAVSLKPEEETKKKISLEGLKGSGERILLVEDEEGVRELATIVLGENGYVVYDAANAEEALDIFDKEAGNFDLIFSDVVLPDKGGLQLVDQLLSQKPDLRVLMSSGYTDQKSQWPIIRERGFRFLQKPYALTDLLQAIREAIGQDSSLT